MGKKRGQISLFLVLALVITISVAVTLQIVAREKKAAFEGEGLLQNQELTSDPASFKANVEQCVGGIAKDLATSLTFLGGSFSKITYSSSTPFSNTGIRFNDVTYRYLCKHKAGKGCVSELITKGDMIKELNAKIRDQSISRCFNYDIFTDAGFEVETGELAIDSGIVDDSINVKISYPTLIQKGSSVINIPFYTTDVAVPLGRMYDLAIEIVNSEITEGQFNKDEWMDSHGSTIRIKKMRPYPDTLYRLIMLVEGQGKEYEFNFALQGEDTVSKLDSKKEPLLFPYCDMNDEHNCYANVDPLLCVSKGGDSTSNPQSCAEDDSEDDECLGGVCDDCTNFGKGDGETWCVYDGITGLGYDRVGSRHSQMSCHNGKIYVEECRDYREGLCTEPVNGEAVCRPNRWEDCAYQVDRRSCQDDDVRDCYWNADLALQNLNGIPFERRKVPNSLCTPQVPPGFKFWLGQGEQVCEMANEVTIFRQPIFQTIRTIRAPQEWVASSASYCSSMGDCGDGRNFVGVKPEYTLGSFYWRSKRFFSSEMEGKGHPIESQTVYGPASYSHDFRLGLRNDVFNKIFGMFYFPSHHNSIVIQQMLDFAQYFSNLKVCQVYKCKRFGTKIDGPPHKAFKQHILAGNTCSVWENRNVANLCGHCSLDPLQTCTEYKCKSLGSGCNYHFNEDTGRGVCNDESLSIENRGPLTAELDEESIPSEFSLQQVDFFDKKINDVVEPIKPQEGFSFTFTTNRESSCSASILPGQDINNGFNGFGQHLLGTCDSGQKCFEIIDNGKEHTVKISMQNNEAYRQRLNDILDINTLLQLFNPELTTISFGGISVSKSQFITFIAGTLNLPEEKAKQFLFDYLLLYDARKNLLFFRCIDSFGKLDVDNIGVLFEIFPQDDVAPSLEIPPATVEKIPIIGTITELSFSFIPTDNRPSIYCSYSLEQDGEFIVEESNYVRTGEEFFIHVDPPSRGDYSFVVSCSDGLQDVSSALTAVVS